MNTSLIENKVIVITGAANGLGKALAIEYARLSAHLALIDIDTIGLNLLLQQLYHPTHRITIHTTNIANEQEIIATHQEIIKHHGYVDILINNAGVSISQVFEHLQIKDIHHLIDINFYGVLLCTKYFLPDLQKRKTAHIVNICSSFASLGFPGKTIYSASKNAIVGLTNALMTELFGSNVFISLVIPPPLETGLVSNGKHINENKKSLEILFVKRYSMPLDIAAKDIVTQVSKKKFRIVIGWRTKIVDCIVRIFPTLSHQILGRFKRFLPFL